MPTTEEIMAKVLVTEQPYKYKDQEVVLKALNYKEDIIVSALINEVLEESKSLGLGQESINQAVFVARILSTIKLSMFKFADEKKRELLPMFVDMETMSRESQTDFQAILDAYVWYHQKLELSKEEKKSS